MKHDTVKHRTVEHDTVELVLALLIAALAVAATIAVIISALGLEHSLAESFTTTARVGGRHLTAGQCPAWFARHHLCASPW